MKQHSLSPWKVHSSKYLIRDPWVTVRADHCETASGADLNPYYVFEYTDWAHIAAFNSVGEILLIEQYRHGIGKVGFELPGGIVEPHEPPLSAIRRELLEETGHLCSECELLLQSFPNPATHTNKVFAFIGTGCEWKAEPKLDSSENIEAQFVKIDEALKLIHEGKFIQSFHVPTIFLALQKLGRLEVR